MFDVTERKTVSSQLEITPLISLVVLVQQLVKDAVDGSSKDTRDFLYIWPKL